MCGYTHAAAIASTSTSALRTTRGFRTPSFAQPTTFIPGSHVFVPDELRTQDHIFDAEAAGGQLGELGAWLPLQRTPVQGRSFMYGESQQGDVILFDVRVVHRGGANRQRGPSAWRSILYCTFTHDWFHDGRNFQPRHTAAFDAFPPYVRSAVARVDQHDYLKGVEGALSDAYVDVTDMASTYEFDTTQYTDALPLRSTAAQRAGMLAPGDLPPGVVAAALQELATRYKWRSSAQPLLQEEGGGTSAAGGA